MMKHACHARRRILLTMALIPAAICAMSHAAVAQDRSEPSSRQNYSIVGQLSDADVMTLWPPARRFTMSGRESRSGRRFYRAYRADGKIPLGDWLPDQSTGRLDGRLTQDESRLKLERDARDRDSDGVPDKQDVYPWDRNRW
jgi:hypothetical protein